MGLEESWRIRSDEEVIAASRQLDTYNEEARGVILAELNRRNLLDKALQRGTPLEKKELHRADGSVLGAPAFYAVSPVSVVVLNLCTFGFYSIYWFAENWRLVRDRKSSGIRPVWRGIFHVFFCYSLFKEIQKTAESLNIGRSLNAGPAAVVWIVLMSLGLLPGPYSLLGFLSVLVLVHVQIVINEINDALSPGFKWKETSIAWIIARGVVAGLIVILILFGVFIPESEVVLRHRLPKYAQEYLDRHSILNRSETLIAYYDRSFWMNGSDSVILTNKRIIDHKDGKSTWIRLQEASVIRHHREFGEDLFLIISDSGKSMEITIGWASKGEIFKWLLMNAWERARTESSAYRRARGISSQAKRIA